MNFYTLDDYTEALKRAGAWDKPPIYRSRAQPGDPDLTEEENDRIVVQRFAFETITQMVLQLLDEVLVEVKDVKELPEDDGIYFLYHRELDYTDRYKQHLIYIGSSKNLKARWQLHYFRDVVGHADYSLFWKSTCYDRFENHMIEEAFYIALFRPDLNVIISTVQLRRFPGDEGPPDELIPALCEMYKARRKR